MRKISILSSLLGAIFSLNASAGFFNSPQEEAIEQVKNIVFEECGNAKYGDMVSVYTKGTDEWTAKKHKDGFFYVNMEGSIMFRDKREQLFMQYLIGEQGVQHYTTKLSGKYLSNMKYRSLELELCEAGKVRISKPAVEQDTNIRDVIESNLPASDNSLANTYALRILKAEFGGEGLYLETNEGEKSIYALGLNESEIKLIEDASKQKSWVCVDDLEYPNHIYPSHLCR